MCILYDTFAVNRNRLAIAFHFNHPEEHSFPKYFLIVAIAIVVNNGALAISIYTNIASRANKPNRMWMFQQRGQRDQM